MMASGDPGATAHVRRHGDVLLLLSRQVRDCRRASSPPSRSLISFVGTMVEPCAPPPPKSPERSALPRRLFLKTANRHDVTIAIARRLRTRHIRAPMKYLPPRLGRTPPAYDRGSLLTFVVLTIAFTLFSSMISLRDAAYERAVTVNRMDRLHISARFVGRGLNIRPSR